MHVARAAHRRRVPEAFRDLLDGADDRLLAPRLVVDLEELGERQRRGDRPGPGPEVLRGERLAADLAQVLVDVVGGDVAPRAIGVDVLEQLLAGELLDLSHQRREAAIPHVDLVLLAALAAEGEADLGAGDLDVAVPHRRQAVAAVLARVLVVPDTDEGRLQQAHDQRQHLLARQAAATQVAIGPPPDPRQRPRELDQAPVLRLVAHLAPARVVAVLLAPARVAAGGLDVPAPDRADPDVGPCRRNGQGLEPRDALGIGDALLIGPEVGEPLAGAAPPYAGAVIGDVAEPCLLGMQLGIVRLKRHLEAPIQATDVPASPPRRSSCHP